MGCLLSLFRVCLTNSQRALEETPGPTCTKCKFLGSMKISNHTITLAVASILLLTSSQAHEYEFARPDSHAPIMVMADHTHESGEWMLSFRQMRMKMEGMRSSETSRASQDVFNANYTVTPTRMTMEMTMLGVMYAPSDKMTLFAMLPYLDSSMDHEIFGMAAPLISLNDGSSTFTTGSSGWGDLKLGTLLPFYKSAGDKAHFGLSFGLPSGSIAETDLVPGPGGRVQRQLPAPMQMGSGSMEFNPSITYISQKESWSYGAQAKADIRLNTNHHDYRLGNSLEASGWIASKLMDQLSISGRIAYKYSEKMSGTQSDLSFNPPFAPSRRTMTAAFSENYGGQRVDAAIGFNYFFNKGSASGNRIALEVVSPIFQDLNGLQLETKLTTILGWQYSW